MRPGQRWQGELTGGLIGVWLVALAGCATAPSQANPPALPHFFEVDAQTTFYCIRVFI